jgi:membrane-bound lytic murein transglycosylase F
MCRHLLIAVALLLLALQGCTRQDSLERIQSSGKLTVITRNSPTTYYRDKEGATGFEYALAQLLAEELGVRLKVKTAFELGGIFQTLQRGEADIAAAGLTLTEPRSDRFPHSDSYYRLTPQVVYVAGTFRPRRLEDLGELSIVVLADSSHAEALRALEQEHGIQLNWREVQGADSMELLEQVDVGQAELAIIDSNEFAVQQSLYPRLKVAFDLGAEQDMVWYLAPETDNGRLKAKIDAFFARLQSDGTLDSLREEHFGHSDGVSRISSHTFMRNMQRKLPRYRGLIRQVAEEYQMDWHLLAAIAYQESHWNPEAASPTGVRGMMMLTLPTAEEMGVDDRLDPAQSLRGGARYFKNIKRRLPGDIYEPDRTWLALAAYNIGMGHLEDARVITERQGGDPHLWRDVMERLPLLQKISYYKDARYGYARGVEAANYVQNIRHYYSILEWQDIPDNKPLPPLQVDEYLPEMVKRLDLRAL